ncbi:MAG: glycosyltransferase family 4 protein [Raineya sp.]|jgi:glycosyltransferase involved in cell wall biosynthesis|nr:glycosyltransferase family 4 protein [Raineya sp.]
MKVAIYVPLDYKPTEGGGFGYIEQICFSLLESKHKTIQIVPLFVHQGGVNAINNSYFYQKFHQKHECILFRNPSLKPPLILRAIRKISKILKLKNYTALLESWADASIKFLKEENQKELDKILRKHQIDLVYYPMPTEKFHFGVPYITTVWDLIHLKAPFLPEISESNQFELREEFYHQILRKATYIVCESGQGKQELLTYYQVNPNKVKVLPMFPSKVIEIKITQEEKDNWLINKSLENKKFIFYPAQFWGHKNHYTLLHALDILRKKYDVEMKLVFTGSDKGNWRYIEKNIENLKLEKNILNLGFVSTKEIKILYETALALVMPTLYDPTSIPVMEAMYSGCPIICSENQGHKEQANSHAEYVNPLSAEDIAERIFHVLKYPQNRVVPQYNSEDITKTLWHMMEEFESIRNLWA